MPKPEIINITSENMRFNVNIINFIIYLILITSFLLEAFRGLTIESTRISDT